MNLVEQTYSQEVYEHIKHELFTDAGNAAFVRNRDKVLRYINTAGAVRQGTVMNKLAGATSFFIIACLDRMVEMSDLLHFAGSGEDRIFVAKDWH